jgi:hypothetical protein
MAFSKPTPQPRRNEVVNYAQSESLEAARLVINRLREVGFLEKNKSFGEAHPGLYDVVFALER